MNWKHFKIIAGITIALLLIPVVAMQFTDEVVWSSMDFILAGVVLLSLGCLLSFLIRNVHSTKKRLLLILCTILMFAILWAELAVGIFNSPIAGN